MDSNLPPNEPSPPPPFYAPPPLTPPPAAATPSRFAGSPPPRKGSGWKVFAFILLGLLMISALLNATHFVSSIIGTGMSRDRTVGPKLEEAVLEDNDAKDKVAVITVDGVIYGQSEDGYDFVEIIKDQLDRARDDKKVKAVILKVDSPGGEVLASDEIYHLIADFQEDTGKPVIASMGNLAASGGYYISAPCRWIVANELTLTGSIGVIMHGFNYRGLMDKIGVRPDVYKSGKFKDMLSPDRSPEEIPPEERAMVQALIDETYAKFKGVVAEGRNAAHKLNGTNGQALAVSWESEADGRVVSGKHALELGLVDQLGNFDTAVDKAMDLAGLEKANLIQYDLKRDLSDLLRLFGQSALKAPSVKINLGMEMPKLQAGQLYFLSTTYVR